MADQARVLHNLTRRAAEAGDDLGEALRRITETVADAIDVDRVAVWQLADDAARSECLDVYERAGGVHSTGSSADARALARAFVDVDDTRVVVIEDARADARVRER